MTQYKLDFKSMSWKKPIPGLNQKSFKMQNKQIRLVEYTREMEPHWCEKMHCGYVLDGIFEIEFEKETVIYNPEDVIMIPSGAEHKHKGKTRTDKVRVIFIEDV